MGKVMELVTILEHFGRSQKKSECGLSIIVGKNKETFTGRSESEMFFNPTVAKGSDS